MNTWCTARLKFDARLVAKNAIYTAFICNFRFWFTRTFLLQIQLTHIFLLRKWFEHTFFVAKTIYAHFVVVTIYAFFVTKRICAHFFCREHGLRVFLRKRFTHFVRKVFARWKLPSGKFRLFGPLWHTLAYFGIPWQTLAHSGPQRVQSTTFDPVLLLFLCFSILSTDLFGAKNTYTLLLL